MNRYRKWLTLVSLALCTILGEFSLAQEENLDEGSLRIVSKAGDYSAQIYIKAEEQGTVSLKERENDKKRTRLGMGETVTLKLAGKPFLIGDASKISWTIAEGHELAHFNGPQKGVKEVTLEISKNIAKGGSINVEVKTEQNSTRITLTAVVPSGISSKHCRLSYDRNSPNFHKRGVPTSTRDGDQVNAGTSAFLELTLTPLDVNFQNILIIERDKGAIPAPSEGSLSYKHTPNPDPVSPSSTNRLPDNIATWVMPVATLKGYKLPQNPIWKCDWNSHWNGKDIATIKTVDQKFHYGWGNIANSIATTTVSKFDSSVARTTAPGNKHQFN